MRDYEWTLFTEFTKTAAYDNIVKIIVLPNDGL